MGEIRVDPLSGLRVLLAPERGVPEPGSARVADPAPWTPALLPDAQAPQREASLDLFTSAAARGHHEELALPRPVAALAELAPEELAAALAGWREAMGAHADAAWVHLQVEEGSGGMARAELMAFDFVPAAVARERERAGAYAARTQGADLLGDLVQAEVRQRLRLVAYDAEAVLLAPYASRVPFQLMVVPRTPAPRFEAPGPLGAGLLSRGLSALAARFGQPPPMALWVRTAPRGATHPSWRVDVLPRLGPPDTVALATGVAVNPVAPEQACAELRAALA